MLERSNRHTNEHAQAHQGAGVPLSGHGLNLTLGFSGVLPEPSDVGSGSSRVGVHQVPRSNGASEVSGFGQVRSLVFGGKKRSVSAGCGCTPGGVLLLSNENSQSPTGIYSADTRHWDFEASKNVDYADGVFAHLDSWLMESGPDQKNEECCGGDACCNSPETRMLEASNKGEQHDAEHYVGNDLAKTRSKALHLHNDSLATGVFA